ncbi:hypothetical protein BS50DRAFT_574848 [Corynespora cassiicola Philippines]|uniref:Uncharacterized protein n=1 Tax=Corynespora cassiicola Philippines TaxID=1448308 RepID=A0A2T2NM33_CORCC|nr:hypothetical protein BS50DRAFT_574848 [Corynespora cassiicola Philippines]
MECEIRGPVPHEGGRRVWKADEGWRGVGVVGVAEAKGGLPAVDGWVWGAKERRGKTRDRAITCPRAGPMGVGHGAEGEVWGMSQWCVGLVDSLWAVFAAFFCRSGTGFFSGSFLLVVFGWGIGRRAGV